MRTKQAETRFKSALARVGQLFGRAVWLAAAMLICSGAAAQNMFVSGTDPRGGEIFNFTWDGKQSIFASGLTDPVALVVDGTGNLFVVDLMIVAGDLRGNAAIVKITPNGTLTIFASRLSYHCHLAAEKTGKLFVADYDSGVIYQYKPDGSRTTFAVLDPGDHPADLAFDSIGNLYMADLGGNIYKYNLSGVLRRQVRTTFGKVPNSAQSLALDSASNLFVVDAGDANGNGNAIYKFTPQGVRSTFAPGPAPAGQAHSETFSHVAFQPMPTCCQ